MKVDACVHWNDSMTSLREVLRKLLRREVESGGDIHNAEFSYAVHWAKLTREWNANRRGRVHTLVKDVISRPDFSPNEFERRYSIVEIDETKYSGASLVALEKVLASLADEKNQEE